MRIKYQLLIFIMSTIPLQFSVAQSTNLVVLGNTVDITTQDTFDKLGVYLDQLSEPFSLLLPGDLPFGNSLETLRDILIFVQCKSNNYSSGGSGLG